MERLWQSFILGSLELSHDGCDGWLWVCSVLKCRTGKLCTHALPDFCWSFQWVCVDEGFGTVVPYVNLLHLTSELLDGRYRPFQLWPRPRDLEDACGVQWLGLERVNSCCWDSDNACICH